MHPHHPSAPAPRALFAISSLGLGHATRSLAIVREYLRRGYEPTILSSGNALVFLRQELGDEAGVEFLHMRDYPALERGTGWRFYWFLAVDLLRTWWLIHWEHRQIQDQAERYEFIFSDGRYGIRSSRVPSLILTHQIVFVPPRALHRFCWLTEWVNLLALRRFDRVLIPDFPASDANLSGRLSHSKQLRGRGHRYVGLLSSYEHAERDQNIDYLFVISGYLLEHKGSFIQTLIEQAGELPGRKVFILGAPQEESSGYERYRREDLEIHPLASGALRQELFARARCVVSRAGYSTIMDLAEHDKRALLIPTPNQTEQEYLAGYLAGLRHYVTCPQSGSLNLAEELTRTGHTRLFQAPWKTADSLRKVCAAVQELRYQHFFSIIVPAHNEAAELPATLRCLLNQAYPDDRYEIIVVENGSTDATADIALQLARAEAPGRITVVRSAAGVSRAKNIGLACTARVSDWTVLCDADTHLGPHFLRHLNTRLNRDGDRLSVGTCTISPHGGAHLYARCWFKAYDVIHRCTRTSYAIQFAETGIARDVGFHEDLNCAEDLHFIRECRGCGDFFFLPTDQVSTSTRRFEAIGYFRLSLRWLVEALLPYRLKKYRKYNVIR